MNDLDNYYDIEIEDASEFVTEVDEIPIVWNFLLGLDRNDLIAELVQNDLDQDATRTTIRFEKDLLICEGDGRRVDSDGWARLRKFQGAGNSVPAKRGKIGVKNHGLKTAFAIGDELHLSSDGQKIIQTLYSEGRDKPPHPGASKEPIPDSEAPEIGCRVLIKRRKEEITPSAGEAITLPAIAQMEMDELFKNACRRIPEQFIGIVSPYAIKRYELVLSHWQLGKANFKFSCSRPRKIFRGKRFEIFRRRCTVSGDKDSLPSSLMEEASIRMFPLEGQLKQRVAFFYQRPRNRHFVEVSWLVNGNGKPKKGVGKFRYPIGYPEGSMHALTGHGTSFSAPIASDTERHGPARNDLTNKQLYKLCEDLLVDTIEFYLVRRWRTTGLNPLVPNPNVSDGDEIVRPLLAKIACDGAMPTLRWKAATLQVMKANKRKTLSKLSGVLKRVSKDDTFVGSKYRFVIPVTTGKECEEIDAPLAAVCLRSELQLDSNIDSELIKLLTNDDADGFVDEFITFDENDAFARIKGEGNDWFPACTNYEAEFTEPPFVRFYLDVIHSWLDCKNKDSDTCLENKLQEALLLPNSNVNPVRFNDLYASAPLPNEIPGLTLPHVLHHEVANHPIFNRRKWRRPKFKFKDFLESGEIQESDDLTKKQFWDWYCQNERKISKSDRTKLAEIEIWPDITGSFFKISDFCVPRDRRSAKILEKSIKQPHASIHKLNLVTIGKKGKTSIRRIPTQDEIDSWMLGWLAHFPIGEVPSSQVKKLLNRFETELSVLLKNQGSTRLLKNTEIILPALAQDGSIQPRNQLVTPSKENDRLELQRRFLLTKRSNSTPLNKLSPTLSKPTVEILLSTFKEDPQNVGALHARLSWFTSLTPEAEDSRQELTELPIIPVQGEYKSPCELAFKGIGKPDYYGNWKIRIPGKGLSQDDQTRFRNVGVTSATLNLSTSIEFFRWLSRQSSKVLERHLNCVLYQFLDKSGPESWIQNYPHDNVIPTLNREGLQLISLHYAKTNNVYIPDVKKELADLIVKNNSRVSLTVTEITGIKHPISGVLKDLGVKSLQEAFGEPKRVTGHGEIKEISSEFVDIFQKLTEPKFRKTIMKRFASLGVDSKLMRHNWQTRLSAIKKLAFSDRVEVHYRFQRRNYTIEESSGFDHKSEVFYVNQQIGENVDIICETIARQLIFTPAAKPMHHLTLKRALEMDFQDHSFRSLDATATTNSSDETNSDTDVPNGHKNEFVDDAETAEATSGHSPYESDTKKNIPKQNPFSTVNSGSSQNPSAGKSKVNSSDSTESGNSSQRQTDSQSSKLEDQHKRQIREQYANHCQVCLCKQVPNILAPVDSYVESAEVRQKVMEVHHVALKHAGGARHAGNLILLCIYHHNNYGRRLTREWITGALEDNPKTKSINFSIDGEENKLKGKIVNIVFPDKGDSVCIFFADLHAKFWLDRMPHH